MVCVNWMVGLIGVGLIGLIGFIDLGLIGLIGNIDWVRLAWLGMCLYIMYILCITLVQVVYNIPVLSFAAIYV